MANQVESLKDAWTRWYAFLKDLSPDCVEHRQVVHTRLLRFCGRHPDDPDHVKTVLACLSKGKHLVEAAVRWENAVAGPRPDTDATPTDRARGEQFRLVMAHGGLEVVLNALLPVPDRGRQEESELRHLLSRCGLSPYQPLPPPRRERAELEKWLSFEEEQGQHPITTFLKLNPNDTRTLRKWLVEGNPVEDWYAALRLAKVLRNSTVHGSLSATKVCRWGLQTPLQTLTENIGELTAAVVGMLVC